jgi:Leucine-rich repeat (LRR) protein
MNILFDKEFIKNNDFNITEESLQLHNKDIVAIIEDSFLNFINLKKLYFNFNQIERIYANTFTGLFNLEVLDLSYNKISKIFLTFIFKIFK